MLGGLPIIWTEHALKDSDVRLFPESKHRSKRIRKKLLRRFGGEFRKMPAIYWTAAGWIIHPALRADVEAAMRGSR